MGRNSKQTADYFPHYAGGNSRTKFILESNWGNDGYAFWFKLLEILCAADGQYYDCWTAMNWEYLLAVTGVSADTAESILDTLADMGKVDAELWRKCRVIWVQSLMESLRSLYSKRASAPEKPSALDFPNRAKEQQATDENSSEQPAMPAQTKSSSARRHRASALSPEQRARFERWYKAYPKKVDPAAAEKAWAKIEPPPDDEQTDRMIAAIEAAKKYDSRFRERQYTPYPASWLNAKGYESDYSQGGGGADGNAGANDGFRSSSGFKA